MIRMKFLLLFLVLLVVTSCSSTDGRDASLLLELPTINNQPNIICQTAPSHTTSTALEGLTGFDDADPAATVADIAKRPMRVMDLHQLQNYGRPIRKSDLLPLSTPAVANTVREIDLTWTSLNDTALEALSSLQLERLVIRRNDLHDLHAIEKMNTLQYLDASDCPLQSAAFKRIGHFHSLRVLKLYATPMTDLDLKQFAGLQHLERIALANCKLSYDALKSLQSHLPRKCALEVGPIPKLDWLYRTTLELEIKGHKCLKAEREIASKLEKLKRVSPPNYAALADTYGFLGRCEACQNRPSEALASYRYSQSLFMKQGSALQRFWHAEDFFDEEVRYMESLGLWKQAIDCRLKREEAAKRLERSIYSLEGFWRQSRAQNCSDLERDYEKVSQFPKGAEMYGR
jgi:hypothetical protein